MSAVNTEHMLEEARSFFNDTIATNHRQNTEKLASLDEFNVNPFTVYYLSAFAFGDVSPESLARTLVYPRALGTSIATSFGQNIQTFCHRVLGGFPSVVPGMDIEFDDQIDGRHKYCQVKAGPQTINSGDPGVVMQHFKDLRNLARTNGMELNDATDCCVAVLYGTVDSLNRHYRVIAEDYPVYVGNDFWLRLTGDATFYGELAVVFASCASEYFDTSVLERTVKELAKDIESHPELLGDAAIIEWR